MQSYRHRQCPSPAGTPSVVQHELHRGGRAAVPLGNSVPRWRKLGRHHAAILGYSREFAGVSTGLQYGALDEPGRRSAGLYLRSGRTCR